MSLTCSISNEVPEFPVVSPVSGCVFERRLIEKFIAENGTDPMNGQELNIEQLIDIKTAPVVKPRPPTATSIPALLKMMQDEWDACMLHSFSLRQQLQTARQELSHALYQHDAACRVIARLTKEVTAAREALATLKPHAASGLGVQQPQYASEADESAQMPTEEAGMTEEVLKKLQDKAAVLTVARKQRGKTVPGGLAKADDIKNYKQMNSFTGLHSASVPGLTALDLQESNTNMMVTGGNDKSVVVFNKETEQVVMSFKGHQKKVTSVIYHPTEDTVISCSPDATIKIWSVGSQLCQHTLKPHEGPISGISLHATGDYVLSVGDDEKWAFSDIRIGRVLCTVGDNSGSAQSMTCAQFHPDGLIFGAGTADSLVKIWDVKERTNVANFPGHTGAVRSISFSENGYYLATAADDASIKLWDLRKLKNFKTIQLNDGYEVKDLCFDQSGSYLAVAGTDVRVYLCKQWQELAILTDHSDMATGVRFGRDAQFLASTSMDRSLKVYGMNVNVA